MSEVNFIPKIAQLPFREPNFKVKRCSECDALFICGKYRYNHCKGMESCVCDFCRIKTEIDPELCKTTIIKAGTREPMVMDTEKEEKEVEPSFYSGDSLNVSTPDFGSVLSRYITLDQRERRENQDGEE